MSEQGSANPWVVKEAKKFEPLPIGFYNASFKGVEDVKLPDGSQKWRFEWEVTSGEHKAKVASSLVDLNISPNTLPGVLISGLLGRAIQPGEDVKASVDGCKGKTYLLSVQPGPKGGKACVRSCGKPPAM